MNPIFEPCVYSLDQLKNMKASILLKGVNSWNHTQYSLISQLIGIITKPDEYRDTEK